MSDEVLYRRQAQLCRDQAIVRPHDRDTNATWLRLAEEYERLADRAAQMRAPEQFPSPSSAPDDPPAHRIR